MVAALFSVLVTLPICLFLWHFITVSIWVWLLLYWGIGTASLLAVLACQLLRNSQNRKEPENCGPEYLSDIQSLKSRNPHQGEWTSPTRI